MAAGDPSATPNALDILQDAVSKTEDDLSIEEAEQALAAVGYSDQRIERTFRSLENQGLIYFVGDSVRITPDD